MDDFLEGLLITIFISASVIGITYFLGGNDIFNIQEYENDCSEYRNFSAKKLPARCIEYYNK